MPYDEEQWPPYDRGVMQELPAPGRAGAVRRPRFRHGNGPERIAPDEVSPPPAPGRMRADPSPVPRQLGRRDSIANAVRVVTEGGDYKRGGKVKKYAKGGAVKRDGCAARGKTKGRVT